MIPVRLQHLSQATVNGKQDYCSRGFHRGTVTQFCLVYRATKGDLGAKPPVESRGETLVGFFASFFILRDFSYLPIYLLNCVRIKMAGMHH